MQHSLNTEVTSICYGYFPVGEGQRQLGFMLHGLLGAYVNIT